MPSNVLLAALGGQLSPCEAAPSIAASWAPTTLIGLRGRAVIAPGFASALRRRSELLNPSWSRWDGYPSPPARFLSAAYFHHAR
jgi:hypothetical protein